MKERNIYTAGSFIMAFLLVMLLPGLSFAADRKYPDLTVSVKDINTFKSIPYVNIAVECGKSGDQCQNDAKCSDVRDWNNPRFGLYRAVSGEMHLKKIGLGDMDVISFGPEQEATGRHFKQSICLKIWKKGYEPLYVEKEIGPGKNSFELNLTPASEKKEEPKEKDEGEQEDEKKEEPEDKVKDKDKQDDEKKEKPEEKVKDKDKQDDKEKEKTEEKGKQDDEEKKVEDEGK